MIQQELRSIDGIEQAKRQFFTESGQHLSVTLHQGHTTLRISNSPVRPVMLPIVKRSRSRQLINSIKATQIKVKRVK